MAKVERNSVPWAGLFFGRQRELEALESAFQRVSNGNGPEICVILGESGLGKTRIAQEFFAHLSKSTDGEDGTRYWPDRMVRDGNNLKINPDPAECNEAGIAQMGFLWWGLRLTDPISRNAGANSFADAITILRSHLEPFAAAKLLSARMRNAAQAVAVDVAVELGNLFTFGLIGLGKLGLDHGREWKSIWDDHRNSGSASAGSEHARETKGIIEMVLRDFETLFEQSERKGDPLPAVILLDDAQWIEDGDLIHQFTAQLLAKAREHRWPILILATHWEKEWHEHLANREPTGFAGLLDGFTAEGWKPITLQKEPDLAGMITAGFPGLSRAQIDLLIEKADGNPRLLDEILRHLQTSRGYFEGRNLASNLTPRGEEAIRERTFDLHSLVAERLSQAPDEVQVAVALSGYQGIKFLSRITAAAAKQIGGSDYADGLAAAERPYSLVATLEHGLAEFSQRVFYEVAKERLPHVVGEEEAIEAIRSVLRSLAGEFARFETLHNEERETALQLGARVMFDPETSEIESEDWELALWCKARLADESTQMFGNNDLRREVVDAWVHDAFGVAVGHEGEQLINRLLFEEFGWDFVKDWMARAITKARRDFEHEQSDENRRWLNDALFDAVTSEYWGQHKAELQIVDGEFVSQEIEPSDTYRSRIHEGLELTEGCETPHLTIAHFRWLHFLRDDLDEDEAELKLDVQRRILDLAEARSALAAITGDWGRLFTIAQLELGTMCSQLGKFDEGVRHLEQALKNIREIDRLEGEISDSLQRRALSHLLWDLPEIGRDDDALRYAEEFESFTRRICDEICTHLPPEKVHSRGCDLPSDLIQVAQAFYYSGQKDRARALLDEVLGEITDDQGNPLMLESSYREPAPRFGFELDMIERSLAAWNKDDAQ